MPRGGSKPKYATEEERRAAYLKSRRAYKQRRRFAERGFSSTHWRDKLGIPPRRAIEVPDHVMTARDLELERWSQFIPTPNIRLLGDPPPWRSALADHHGSSR